jgi:acyl-CoA hydrolase
MLVPEETSRIHLLSFSSDAALRRRFMVTDEPVPANLRVGLLLEVLDKLAEETALAYARQTYPQARVVTAAIDSLAVRGVPDINRDMVLRARINYIGRTSLEVGVRIDQPGEPLLHIASSYVSMVARLSENGVERSVSLPPLDYRTQQDQDRAARAVERREAYRASRSAAEEPPTREEYIMLRQLHEAHRKPGAEVLLVSDLVTSGWERTYPEHENVPQKIFGGYVAHRAYMYAHICAEMVATGRMLLTSVDRINFYQPVRMGDKLHFVSRVTFTGDTSVSVETEITRISRDRKMTALSNNCTFVFVHVDSDLNPLPVAPVHPTTYAEDERYLAGYRRRKAHRAACAENEAAKA